MKLAKRGQWRRELGSDNGREYDRLIWVTPARRPRPAPADERYGPFLLKAVFTRREGEHFVRPRFVGWWVSLPDAEGVGEWWHLWRRRADAQEQAAAVAAAIGASIEAHARAREAVAA